MEFILKFYFKKNPRGNWSKNWLKSCLSEILSNLIAARRKCIKTIYIYNISAVFTQDSVDLYFFPVCLWKYKQQQSITVRWSRKIKKGNDALRTVQLCLEILPLECIETLYIFRFSSRVYTSLTGNVIRHIWVPQSIQGDSECAEENRLCCQSRS